MFAAAALNIQQWGQDEQWRKPKWPVISTEGVRRIQQGDGCKLSLPQRTVPLCPAANWRHSFLKKIQKRCISGFGSKSQNRCINRSNLKQRGGRIISAQHQIQPILTLTPPPPPLLYPLPPHSHMLTRVAPNGLNEGHLGDGIRLR